MTKKGFVFILILVLILAPLLTYGLKRVERGEIGVKTRLFPITGKKGIDPAPRSPGIYLLVPYAETLDIFSGRIQKLELTASPDQGDRQGKDSVFIQTSDGTTVFVDATLLFRVIPDGAPRLLASLGHDYVDRKVRPEFIAVLKYKLGELSAESFYNVEAREKQAMAARDEFNRRMKANGIEAVQVLIRDFQYRKEFEAAIQERKIADQLKLMNQSRSAASEQASELARVTAKGDAMAKVEVERGRTEAEKIRARADLYLKQKQAEGNGLVESARAEGDQLIEKAMAGNGGRLIVALQMAEVMKGLDKIVVQSGGKQGVNPLDLKTLLKLAGVEQ